MPEKKIPEFRSVIRSVVGMVLGVIISSLLGLILDSKGPLIAYNLLSTYFSKPTGMQVTNIFWTSMILIWLIISILVFWKLIQSKWEIKVVLIPPLLILSGLIFFESSIGFEDTAFDRCAIVLKQKYPDGLFNQNRGLMSMKERAQINECVSRLMPFPWIGKPGNIVTVQEFPMSSPTRSGIQYVSFIYGFRVKHGMTILCQILNGYEISD